MEIENTNIGSLDNPVYLKNKHQNSKLSKEYMSRGEVYVHRPLLQRCTKHNNGDEFAFDKAPEGYEQYTSNVISNPNLQPLDIKVALALFEMLDWRNNDEGKVYICTTKELDLESYGDYGQEINFSDGYEREIVEMPLTEQLAKLFNISISTDVLNKVLTRLDSFHYISVTPVSMANSKLGKSTSESKKIKAYLKLIEINDMMDSKNLTNIWVKN
jgi:hypothetical protein